MKPVVSHPEAVAELRAAIAYYEERRPGLGARFRLDFEETLALIQSNPSMFAADEDDMRACSLRRFPYTLHYADLTDHIWLAAVAHQSRRPGFWSGRQP